MSLWLIISKWANKWIYTYLYSSYTSCFGSEVSGCSSKWFRIQLKAYICWVRLDDVEFWSLEEKRGEINGFPESSITDVSLLVGFVYMAWQHNCFYFVSDFDKVVKFLVPCCRTCRPPLIFSPIGHHGEN